MLAVLVHADPPITDTTIRLIEIEELVALETAVWQALVDGDPAADARALADDFLGVYPTGYADRDDHCAQLADGPTVRSFELTEIRMLVVSESAVLLAYRAEYVRPGEGSQPESMYVSSLWCRRDDQWVNVFSQDTPDTGLPVV
jgi:hypothetical protein